MKDTIKKSKFLSEGNIFFIPLVGESAQKTWYHKVIREECGEDLFSGKERELSEVEIKQKNGKVFYGVVIRKKSNDIGSMELLMEKIKEFYNFIISSPEYENKKVVIPKIISPSGGIKWGKIKKQIVELFKNNENCIIYGWFWFF